MQKLHNALMAKNGVYASWHNYQGHRAFHWLLLVVFLGSFSFILYNNGLSFGGGIYAPTSLAAANSCPASPSPKISKPSKDAALKADQDIAFSGAGLFTNFQKFNKGKGAAKYQAATNMLQLALKRKVAMLAAMQDNSESAFTHLIISKQDRDAIKNFANNCIEEPISLSGSLSIEHADLADKNGNLTGEDQEFYTLNTPQGQYQVHFANGDVVPLSLSGHEFTLNGWKLDRELLVDAGRKDNIKLADSAETINKFSLVNNAQAATSYPSDKSNNIIPNRALVVLANYTDAQDTTITNAIAQNYFNTTVNNFFTETSYNKTSLAADVAGWYSLPMSASQAASIISSGNIDQLVSAVVTTLGPAINYSQYRHLVIFSPFAYNGYGGVEYSNYTVNAPSGQIPMQVEVVWDRNSKNSNPSYDLLQGNSLLHEMSHGFDAYHDDSIGCPTGGSAYNVGGGLGCLALWYGNFYSLMSTNTGLYGHHSAQNKAQNIGWLTAPNLLDVSTSTAPTTVTIEPFETTSLGVKSIRWKISDGDWMGPRYFYIEYRQPIGFDAGFSGYPGTYQGVLVGTTAIFGPQMGDPEIIDMSPSYNGTDISTAYPNPSNSVTLQTGQTFTDPATGFKVTVNSVSSAGANVTVTPGISDSQYPTVAITSPVNTAGLTCDVIPTSTIVSGIVNFTANASDNSGIAEVDYSLGGMTKTPPYNYTWDTTLKPNGWYNVYARVYDLVGNNTTGCWVGLAINNPPDTQAPVVQLSAPVNGGSYVGANLVIAGTATDNNGLSRIEYWKDSDTAPFYTSNVSSFTPTSSVLQLPIASLPTGQHTIWARAYDFWGNVSDSQHINFNQNAQVVGANYGVAPNVTWQSPLNNGQVSGTATVAVTNTPVTGWALVNLANVKFTIDGVNICTDTSAPFSCSWNTATITNGSHTLTAYGCDTYGNCAPYAITVNVNNSVSSNSHLSLAPLSMSFSAASGSSAPAPQNLSLSNNGSLTSNWSITTDQNWCHAGQQSGSTAAGSASSISIYVDNPSNVGTFNCNVTITDPAADNSPQVLKVTYTVSSPPDTQAPTTPTNLSATAVSSSQINLTWSAASDNVGVAGYNIFRNGTKIAAVTTTSYSSTGLSQGTTYTYTVSAYDAAGNTSAQSIAATATTLVPVPDTTPPTVSITSPINGSKISGSTVTIQASASDNIGVTKVVIAIDGKAVVTDTLLPYTYKWQIKKVSSGSHTITATAYDAAGNTGVATITVVK